MVGVSPLSSVGSSILINAFGGMVPATGARLLPDSAAVLSQNTWLYDGELIGLVAPTYVKDLLSSASGKAYRIPNNYFDAAHFGDATWMEFTSIDTDVVRSPIVGDTFDRYYWASPVAAPQVNSHAGITAGSPAYLLGVPQPAAATLAITGGSSATIVSRAYAVTWFTAFNEEGPPCTPVVGSGKIDATWTLTLTPPSGGVVTSNNIAKANIYRTVTSAAGVATYFFVAQVVYSTTSYADTALDATVSLNNQLVSTTWSAPPSDLLGVVALPNGMLAGWRGSEIWFCEPYRPHAWPAAYAVSTEYPIVGLGTINQTLVVLTAGYPVVATGLNPSSMTLSKLAAFEPCMSRGSILSTPEGVYYASPNGLVLVANGIATVVTLGLIMKDEWNRLNNVATMRATRLAGAYFAFGSSRPGFTQIDTWEQDMVQLSDFTGSYNGITIDLTNQRVALNTMLSVTPTVNVFNDPWSGETMVIRDGKIYRLDVSNETGPRQTALWRSKIFQPQDKKNYQALRVYFDVPPWAPALNPVRNTSPIQTLQSDQWGLVRIYADGKLVMTRELRVSSELMKIPSGFKADFWQIEFETILKIQSVQMATSDKELKKT
jgi:hypothetical protein